MRTLRLAFVVGLAALSLGTTGCALMHELKPHRLSRWNQGPKLGRDTSNFSISDPEASRNSTVTVRRVSTILD